MSNLHEENQGKKEVIGIRYLSFSLGIEEYAIPLLAVREVIAMPEVTPIPYTPPYFLGIMNLRGQVISIMDLRNKLNIKPLGSAETSVIICDLNPLSIGVVVDSINYVLSPSANEVSEKPEIQGNRNVNFITGVYQKDKKLILFLDIAKTLNVEDKTIVANTVEAKKSA